MPIVTREHFNRWYSIKAYYFAMTFADLPLQILCVFVFVAITYLMTAQPLELFRIGLFYLIAVMVTLVSQGWGMIVGAACDVKVRIQLNFTSNSFYSMSPFNIKILLEAHICDNSMD